MVSATGPLCDTCVQALGLVSALETAEAAHLLRGVELRGDGSTSAQVAIAVVRHAAILWALVRLSEALSANGAARTGAGGE